ncbi:uncharacterized protein LOC111059401 isoform X1 [Nilaparvata lugens]|uniref:uncharacterized protein LOC111059401 isoform X1 n=1 Tax=Nilaparvata lugens TaxID=108931 RepID=UPI00193D7DA6|nr:uncharacterized protein LOC111059401 isoform X1 [Nilaparvata lugens]
METFNFFNLHKANVRNSCILGLLVPGPKRQGASFKAFVFALDVYQVSVFCFMIYGIFYQTRIHSILVDIDAAYCTLFGFAVSFYYSFCTKSFENILSKIDELTEACISDPLDKGHTFRTNIITENALLSKCTSIIPLSMSLCPFIFYAVTIVKMIKISGEEENESGSIDHSQIAEAAQVVVSMMSIQLGITRKASVEWFVLSLMAHIRTYFNHLEATLMQVFQLDNNNVDEQLNSSHFGNLFNHSQGVALPKAKDKLKLWIQIHQKLLRLTEDLIRVLSPFLAFYLVNITSLSALTVYAITMDKELNLVEKISMGYFGVTSMITLFFLCFFGSQLYLKSEKLAEAAFWKSFEDGDSTVSKEVHSCLRLILWRSHSPVLFAPYKSPTFTFTNESFVSHYLSFIA